MKRFVIFVFASACLSLTAATRPLKHPRLHLTAPAPVADSLILNASFENGLTSWNNWWGTTARITSGQRSGTGGLSVSAGSGEYQDVTARLQAGHTYHLTAYEKALASSGFSNSSIGVQAWDASKNYLLNSTASLSVYSTAYQPLSITFTVPSGVVSAYVSALDWDTSTGAYFDDFHLTDTTTPQTSSAASDPTPQPTPTPTPSSIAGITTIKADWATYNLPPGPYWASNGTWNKDSLVNGKDYTESLTLDKANFPNNTVMTWSWPNTPAPGNVYASPCVVYGAASGYARSGGMIPAKQVNAINTLMLTHNVTFGGNVHQYDVIYDFQLYPDVASLSSAKFVPGLVEIEVSLHEPTYYSDWVKALPKYNSYKDNQGLQWIISYSPTGNPPIIIFAPADYRDLTNYTVDLRALLLAAKANGLLTGNEYFGGLVLGAEPRMSASTMTINTLSIDYN